MKKEDLMPRALADIVLATARTLGKDLATIKPELHVGTNLIFNEQVYQARLSERSPENTPDPEKIVSSFWEVCVVYAPCIEEDCLVTGRTDTVHRIKLNLIWLFKLKSGFGYVPYVLTEEASERVLRELPEAILRQVLDYVRQVHVPKLIEKLREFQNSSEEWRRHHLYRSGQGGHDLKETHPTDPVRVWRRL